jgi:hypothetical protein
VDSRDGSTGPVRLEPELASPWLRDSAFAVLLGGVAQQPAGLEPLDGRAERHLDYAWVASDLDRTGDGGAVLRTLPQAEFDARESAGGLRADDRVELRSEKKHSGRNVQVGHRDDHHGQTAER